MILVADRLGQLGNRLFQFAHLIAFAAERGLRVANPGFQDYARDFPAFAGDALCRWPAARVAVPPRLTETLHRQTEVLVGLARRARGGRGPLRLVETEAGDERSIAELGIARMGGRARLVLVTGWGLRDDAALARQAALLRALFAPAAERARAADAAVAAARARGEVLVGLHVRRGDYARFARGRYFWSPDEYAEIARRARELVPGRRVAVLACGDDREALRAIPDVAHGPGQLVEDLAALGRCDLILGPPSTFSAWAAFAGRVPLRHLEAPDEPLALDAFREPI